MRRPRHYPRWLRLWHAVHALVFLLLVISGLALHYTGTPVALLPFPLAVEAHNWSGAAFALTWLAFVVLNVRRKNVVYYRLPKPLLSSMRRQLAWYAVGMFRGARRPFPHSRNRKFNPLQLASYLIVMYALSPAIVLSGIALYFPELAPDRVAGAGGVWPIALIHLTVAWFLSLFLLLHLYMITTGRRPTSYLREIITGRGEDEREEGTPSAEGDAVHGANDPRSGRPRE